MTTAERTKWANDAIRNRELWQAIDPPTVEALRECVRLAECWDILKAKFPEREDSCITTVYTVRAIMNRLERGERIQGEPGLTPIGPTWRDELGVRRMK